MMILIAHIAKKKGIFKIISKCTKKFDLYKIPKILVIHLKRFTFGQFRKEKLNQNIVFP